MAAAVEEERRRKQAESLKETHETQTKPSLEQNHLAGESCRHFRQVVDSLVYSLNPLSVRVSGSCRQIDRVHTLPPSTQIFRGVCMCPSVTSVSIYIYYFFYLFLLAF